MNLAILEKAQAATAAIAEAAAEIRQLPDLELVQLYTAGRPTAALREVIEAPPATKKPKSKKPPPSKKKPVQAAEPTAPESAEDRTAKLVTAALEAVRAGQGMPVRSGEIVNALAAKFDVKTYRVREALIALRDQKLIEGQGTGPGLTYRVSGRQTPATKRKPARGSDEEEGGGGHELDQEEPVKPADSTSRLRLVPPASDAPEAPAMVAPLASTARIGAPNAGEESHERRRRLYADIASRGVCRYRDVLSGQDGGRHLMALVRQRLVFQRGLGPDSLLAVREDLLPAEEVSGVHRLPMFEAGPGDRRDDCAHYDGCLDRFSKRSDATQAHCPVGCASYAAVPAHVRQGLAHAHVRRSKP